VKSDEMLMYPDEYRVMFEIEDQYWWYHGLRTLLQALLARYAPPGATILDAGCGTGANLQLLQTFGRAVGVDLSEQAIAYCRARGIPRDRAFLASLTDLPFPDHFFDLVVSFDVICNIPDDRQAFRECARVLKQGGRFITQLPAYQWLWSTHDVAVGHQRRYDARALRERVAAAGLLIERLTYTNSLLLPLVAVMRLLHRHRLHNGSAVQSDLAIPLPKWINASLSAFTRAEMRMVLHVNSPFGLSVLVVARKPAGDDSRLAKREVSERPTDDRDPRQSLRSLLP
jgi:SAM-dependent methyltransferase